MMMKIKCWIGGGAAAAAAGNSTATSDRSCCTAEPSTTADHGENSDVIVSSNNDSNHCIHNKMRPTSLNVNHRHHHNFIDLKKFLRDALNPWRARETCGVVPAQHIRELFNEFNFSPSERQVTDMLQTAKQFARRYQLDGGKTQLDGLTFGEFCILLADLRGFRTCNMLPNGHDHNASGSTSPGVSMSRAGERPLRNRFLKLHRQSENDSNESPVNSKFSSAAGDTSASQSRKYNGVQLAKINDPIMVNNQSVEKASERLVMQSPSEAGDRSNDLLVGAVSDGPEVFLGGSCNPTTWRADVAIPTLNKLGISFYNPQVSDWTPDLIELEHRAKEKARVLFFVMDSETRASAGAIEAAHIAGSNVKQLVLVLHPYKRNQKILNEPISKQEFIDLTRNQNLLRLLVIRRGLPILDSIPSGLQRTKAILSGVEDGRSPPSNIASRLISVRRAFDRLVGKNDDEITIPECQMALAYLGYTNSILSEDNIKKILQVHRDITTTSKNNKHDIILRRQSSQNQIGKCSGTNSGNNGSSSSSSGSGGASRTISINFEEFCVVAAYLSVMQQELNENTCVSPIKGTNLPPPPIFLTNAPEWIHNRTSSFVESTTITTIEEGVTIRQKQFYNFRLKASVSRESQRKRDSGTSSPLPQEHTTKEPHLEHSHNNSSGHIKLPSGSSGSSLNRHLITPANALTSRGTSSSGDFVSAEDVDDDESNDSVFSDDASSSSSDAGVEMRDIYLGGSCMRRTRWRQDYVIPQLKERGFSYYNPDDFGGNLSMGDIQFMSEMTNKSDVHVRIVEEEEDESGGAAAGSTVKTIEENDEEDEDADQVRQLLDEPVFDPALLDASRVLLFVITNETRSLAPMTLAAHYIGLGYDVVLCVQMLTDNSIINGNERLTQTATKDYNRGRQYLIDLATRQRIPVYDNVQAATECAIEKANMHKSIASI